MKPKKNFKSIKLALKLPLFYLKNVLQNVKKKKHSRETKTKDQQQNNLENEEVIYEITLRNKPEISNLSLDSGNVSDDISNESFYDANESFDEFFDRSSLRSSPELSLISTLNTPTSQIIAYIPKVVTICDEEFNEEVLDLSKQKNIALQVLSQLRIGMDLESFSLPSFILESRSILEMYADFYSYPKFFLQIPDAKSQHERMIRVVKWFMTTFRSKILAKKPYNPVLGETFQCFYDTDTESCQESVTDGPIPWANKNQLSFLAEQVSHHPPVTAFYLEHYNKRIQMNGFTHSKIKFLGLSVSVESVGNAMLSLLDHQEEYVFTFPSAYARSILTVPWIEMSGLVKISCAQTGYSADINFLTKPFYGGKAHQVIGSIFSPEMKVLNTLDGSWDEKLYIGDMNQKEELHDQKMLVKYRKNLRKLDEQDDFESRKIWNEVTNSLRNKQSDLASKAKNTVEQKQRDEAKFRKENSIEWKNRHFEMINDVWVYKKPLSSRLLKS